MNDLWKVGGKDLLRGVINAVLIAIFVGLAGIVSAPGFDIFSADWASILKAMANWGVISFISYVGAMFTSDRQGKILGSI